MQSLCTFKNIPDPVKIETVFYGVESELATQNDIGVKYLYCKRRKNGAMPKKRGSNITV